MSELEFVKIVKVMTVLTSSNRPQVVMTCSPSNLIYHHRYF